MSNINWEDAIFGYVPQEFKKWYLEESGTYWDNNKWRVSSEIIGQDYSRKDLKKQYPYNVYKANLFQDKISSARQVIQEKVMDKAKGYIISNKNIFELIRDGKTDISYQYDGADYIEEIRFGSL